MLSSSTWGEQINVCRYWYPGSRDRGGLMQGLPADIERVVVTSYTVFIAAKPPKGFLWGQRDAFWMITTKQRKHVLLTEFPSLWGRRRCIYKMTHPAVSFWCDCNYSPGTLCPPSYYAWNSLCIDWCCIAHCRSIHCVNSKQCHYCHTTVSHWPNLHRRRVWLLKPPRLLVGGGLIS